MNDKVKNYTMQEIDIITSALDMYLKSLQRAYKAALDGKRGEYANLIKKDYDLVLALKMKL